MVVAAQESATSPAVRARARRQRDEELLVWPDLVFVEFISAMVFLLSLTALSILINAPLLDRANPGLTPNPSKAPWYFLNLQELLLHMDPALAGVIVPTVALIALGAIPYYDRSNEGQGEWFATPGSIRLSVIGALVGTIGCWILILFDASKHVVTYESLTGAKWPVALNFLKNARAIQNDLHFWDSLRKIPVGGYIPSTQLGFDPVVLNLNIPELFVAQIIPVSLMVGLPILMALVLWKTGIAKSRRDHMIAQFSGFIAVYIVLTIVGTAFRGQGMELLPPWLVKPPVS